MREILRDLTRLEGVHWALLTGQDGLIVASSGDGGEDEDLKAALAAAIYGTIERAITRIDIGTLNDTLIETSSHTVQLTRLGDLLLIVVSDRGVHLGLVRVEMRRAARQVEQRLACLVPRQEWGCSGH